MAKHAWTYDHVIDFTNSKVIGSRSHHTRKGGFTVRANASRESANKRLSMCIRKNQQ